MRFGQRPLTLLAVGGALLAIAAGLGVAISTASSRVPAVPVVPGAVTYYPTPTSLATATVPATATSAPTAAPTATPAPTPVVYVVQDGDTPWDIALKYRMSVDDLMAANPGVNPALLRSGARLVIPIAGAAPAVQVSRPITLDAMVSNLVNVDGVNLALRKGPGTSQDLIARLPAFTPLKILGRTEDSAWLKVSNTQGLEGWVFTLYLDILPNLSMASLDILSRDVVRPPIQLAVSTPSTATGSGTPAPTRIVSGGPASYPYISGIGARSRAIFAAGQKLGNRPGSVALVGDSNTDNPAFFKPFAWGTYDLAGFAYLQPTIDFFKGSFLHDSPAAVGGFNTTKVLDPANARAGCLPGESPLRCEYRQTKPSVALILIGTGDQHTWQGYEGRLRQILNETIDLGIIPVLITKADDLETKDNTAPLGYINGIIIRLAGEYGTPLLNLRAVVDTLPNKGCIADGFHYNKPADGQAANFSAAYLQYGYNQRNLTALQVLDLLRRQVIAP
ncbi:MAG: SH3 domain-containing protein [Thermoflexales bacterium]|nr:SH3 domain-containing protein [Thermoflexales bacterium]